ncbi:peptidoglycan editing factor PgeF [Aromatoleum aromaticum]|uniref:peptidoglycan editing factor PgeF n=1 Tax=Aromatoleum aromaticum TaxID=551760 RepID=UPI001459937E|nr:peptidoglycan editing factor PgeF [Aromatoleum aromaticum]NMG53264.1 peptidoglycan editing factor PgeF [Aromatoleum aromaticum]
MTEDWIEPDWPAPPRVRGLVTTRHGGVSTGPYASMNLGLHVGDSVADVRRNRALLRKCLPDEPAWLDQVHGVAVADADRIGILARADASVARRRGAVCAVMTADCLPVLFCNDEGSVVAAAHAGWRGLAAGVLDATLARMDVPAATVMAWLGPAIGPAAFEVGDEVRAAFLATDPATAIAFRRAGGAGKWTADLFLLARLRLAALGVSRAYGGGLCTYAERERFFSYRREGITGRFVSMVWLAP